MIQMQTIWKDKDDFGFDNKDFSMAWFVNRANKSSTGNDSYFISNTIKYILEDVDKAQEKIALNFKNAQREDVMENKGFEIERIYLLKSFQGKGFGKKLFHKTIDIGRSKGYKKLWLGVWENNKSAI